MERILKTALLLTMLFTTQSPAFSMKTSNDNNRLWYDKPADNWFEALQLGNSHLAAMVYGKNQ